MPDIYMFKIPRAEAEFDGNRLKVRLFYQANAEVLNKRLPAAPQYGIEVLEKLLREGRAEIANSQYPIRSASGGALDILSNGKIVSHRRDGGTKVNPYHHGVASGFPISGEEARDPFMVGVREASEEHLFVTREKPHRLLVPSDLEGSKFTLEKAKQLGIDTDKHVKVGVDYKGGPDVLEFYAYDGQCVGWPDGFVAVAWDSETALNYYIQRVWDFDPENMLPIDAEGMEKDGKFIHFNREIFVFDSENLKSLSYGDRIPNPVVYKLGADKAPQLQTEEPADAPYIFKPDDGLTRMLYGLGIWKGSWVEAEIERERRKISQK